MATGAKPTSNSPPPGEARQGAVTSVEKRATKSGNPMLVLTIGEERVSFFEAEDVGLPITIGDSITFTLTRKGNYLNGKGLLVLPKFPPQPQPQPKPPPPRPAQAPPPPQPHAKPKPAPAKLAPGERPALHELDATQLLALYAQESAAAKVEPARLGQISNQVRYARIEQSLAELKGLLREVLGLMEKTYFKSKEAE